MLVIFDRSASIWESYDSDGTHDWKTVLAFFQALVNGSDVAEDGVNFALATFSEDYIIHAGFNYSYNKEDLVQLATFNNTTPGGETWIPHHSGGVELHFLQTNYGLVVDILKDAYGNKTYGARDDARPLVFLVTDGSMDDQTSGIYDLNGCPTAGSGLACGFGNQLADKGAEVVRAEACKKCWRDDLAKRMYRIGVKGLGVKGGVSVIGIGNPDNPTNAPDARTLKVFVHDDADVTRT